MAVPFDLLIAGATLLDEGPSAVNEANVAGEAAAARQPAPTSNEPVDVAIQQGRIVAISPASGQNHDVTASAKYTLNAEGALLLPGFVDIQVHFRTPGDQESETIASGSQAAALGGITACVMMPNTTPAIDSVQMVREVLETATDAVCDVRTSACITLGRSGSAPVDFAALYATGVRVFTDDGDAVADSEIMQTALLATTRLPGAVISQHAEDPDLVAGGAINAGEVSERLGVKGRPAAAEAQIVERDLQLARTTQGRYHVLHLSTAAALELVKEAKAAGVKASAEVTPQHLALTERDVLRLGTDAKMNPPLRTPGDVAALRRGLVDGVLDAVATDHAPHKPELKALPLAEAAPGMLGVETMAAVLWTELVEPGHMTPQRFVEVVSTTPAAIAGISEHGRPVAVGEPANLVVFDPRAQWQVDRHSLHSLSLNTPWDGRKLTGRVRHTVLAGTTVVQDGQLC